MKRLLGCVFFLALLGGVVAVPLLYGQGKPDPVGKGDERPAKDSPAKPERMVILAQHLPAADLASVLSKHYQNEPGVTVVAEPLSNTLLLSAPAGVIEGVVKLVSQLDRPPRLVEVEVILVEVNSGKDQPAKEFDTKDLNGPIDEVMTKVQALRKSGPLGSMKRFQVTAVETQRARTMVGENKPYTTGMNVTPTGIAASVINYREVGTTVSVTARVMQDKTVNLDLDLQDARMHQPEDGVVLGTKDKGTPVTATEFVTSSVGTKVSVPAGHAAVVSGVKTNSKSQNTQTLVIVTARVLGSEGK